MATVSDPNPESRTAEAKSHGKRPRSDASSATRRKSALACDGCRRRRSRCDSLDAHGCHRCKQLGAVCVFSGFNPSLLLAFKDSGFSPNGPSTSPPIDRPPDEADRQIETADDLPMVTDPAVVERADELWAADSASWKHAAWMNDDSMEPSSRSRGVGFMSFLGGDIQLTTVTGQCPDSDASLQHVEDVDTSSGISRAELLSPASERRNGPWSLVQADPESYGQILRGLKVNVEYGLEDPVAKGFIDVDQAETAYQIFKHQCSRVFPHPDFLLTQSRLSSHPFLRSVILLYASRCSLRLDPFSPPQIHRLESTVMHNLMAYHRGCRPSLQSIMAAFLLSLLPPAVVRDNVDVLDPQDLDPARMIGISIGQLREIGHTVKFQSLLAEMSKLGDKSLLETDLTDARMQMSVIARGVWLNISRCPCSEIPSTFQPYHERFLELTMQERTLTTDVDLHLAIEHTCLRFLLQFTNRWLELELSTSANSLDLAAGNACSRETVQSLEEVATSARKSSRAPCSLPYLLCEIAYWQWWVTMRSVWYAYRLPSPLVTETVSAEWLVGAGAAGEASLVMIERCVDEKWELCVYPKAIGMAVIMCYLSLSTARLHWRHYRPSGATLEAMPICLDCEDQLDQVERYIMKRCPALGPTLARTQISIDEYRQSIQSYQSSFQSTDLGQSENLFAGVSAFDLSLWGGITMSAGVLQAGESFSLPDMGTGSTDGLNTYGNDSMPWPGFEEQENDWFSRITGN